MSKNKNEATKYILTETGQTNTGELGALVAVEGKDGGWIYAASEVPAAGRTIKQTARLLLSDVKRIYGELPVQEVF